MADAIKRQDDDDLHPAQFADGGLDLRQWGLLESLPQEEDEDDGAISRTSVFLEFLLLR